ncbi:MAG: hypothetical protein CMH64_04790 [Nanoarchaeota archaeon]|nr:hypothetical protein [Nanoarchaeota archaeon]|tara:strand:+ start:2135 stop:2524 length:390 start_codon:yes stop_codon:yes gene_type:complete
MKNLLLIITLTFLVFVSGCISQERKIEESTELNSFAKCLRDSGLKMYGSYTCAICKKQRSLFDSSFEIIGEVECHPRGENPETERCLKMDIQKTPTWILEKDEIEIKRLEGYQTLENLAELSGCQIMGA